MPTTTTSNQPIRQPDPVTIVAGWWENDCFIHRHTLNLVGEVFTGRAGIQVKSIRRQGGHVVIEDTDGRETSYNLPLPLASEFGGGFGPGVDC